MVRIQKDGPSPPVSSFNNGRAWCLIKGPRPSQAAASLPGAGTRDDGFPRMLQCCNFLDLGLAASWSHSSAILDHRMAFRMFGNLERYGWMDLGWWLALMHQYSPEFFYGTSHRGLFLILCLGSPGSGSWVLGFLLFWALNKAWRCFRLGENWTQVWLLFWQNSESLIKSTSSFEALISTVEWRGVMCYSAWMLSNDLSPWWLSNQILYMDLYSVEFFTWEKYIGGNILICFWRLRSAICELQCEILLFCLTIHSYINYLWPYD